MNTVLLLHTLAELRAKNIDHGCIIYCNLFLEYY
jgi:hypothetical protein